MEDRVTRGLGGRPARAFAHQGLLDDFDVGVLNLDFDVLEIGHDESGIRVAEAAGSGRSAAPVISPGFFLVLNRYLPITCSSTRADWVMKISSPSLR